MVLLKCIIVALFSIVSIRAAAAGQSVTIYAWPTNSQQPQELAKIAYNQDPLSKPTVSDFKAPVIGNLKRGVEDLVRVGLYDPSTKEWRGVVTSADSFDTKYQQKLSLHIDLEGSPWHLSFSAYPKPKPLPKARRQGEPVEIVPQVVSEIVTPKPGPTPHLNRPVVLRPDGKVEEKEPEKTFLQKWWWAILIFLAIQVLSGTAGSAKE